MPVQMSCPKCSKSYSVPDDKAQKKINCPTCKTLLERGSPSPRFPPIQPSIPSFPPLNSPSPNFPPIEPPPSEPKSKVKSKQQLKNELPKTKSGTGKILVIFGIVFFLVFIGVGVGAYFYLNRGVTKDDSKTIAKNSAGGKKSSANMASLVFKSRTPEQVYKELLSSTAWIITNYGSGSGVLVHPEEKLVLTNYHVIDNDRSPLVYFPELRGDSLVSEPSAYLGNKASAIKSRVVMRDPGRDLALLRLENLPLKVQPVALAKKSADVGAKLFSIGASGANFNYGNAKGALWRLSTGDVRQVYAHEFRFFNGQTVNSKVVETQAPVNSGDSGGPLVNDRVELVGIVSAFSAKDRQVSLNIDISEVRDILGRYFRLKGQEWVDVRPSMPGLMDSTEEAKPPSFWLEVMKEGDDSQVEAAKGMLVRFGTKALPELREAIKDPKKSTRIAGLDCVTLIGKNASEMVPDLQELIADANCDVDVKIAAIRAIGLLGPSARASVPTLIQSLTDSNNHVREITVSTLSRFLPFNEKDLPTFTGLLSHKEASIREFAIRSVADMKASADEIYKLIQPMYQDKAPEVRAVAVRSSVGIAKNYKEKVINDIFKLSNDENDEVRNSVEEIMAKLAPYSAKELEPFLQYLGPQSEARLRNQTIKLIASSDVDMTPYVDGFAYALTERDRELRIIILAGFSKITSTQPLKVAVAVIPLVADEDKPVQEAAKKVMGQINIVSSTDIQMLSGFLKSNNKMQVRLQALNLLMNAKNLVWDPIIKDLAVCLSDPEIELRKTALKAVFLIGNSGKDLAPEVITLTKDKDAAIKLEAFKALSVVGRDPKALNVLFEGLSDLDLMVNEACSTVLKDIKPPIGPKDLDLVKIPLTKEHKFGKIFALKTLLGLGKEIVPLTPEIGKSLKEVDKDVKLLALEALVYCGPNCKDFLGDIVDMAKVDNGPTPDQLILRKQAFITLNKLGPDSASVVSALGDMVESKDMEVSESALKVLGSIGKESLPALNKMIFAFNNRVLLPVAAEQISKIGIEAVKPLIKGLDSISPEIRIGCVVALGRMGPVAKEAAPGLAKLAFQDKVPLIRTEAKTAQTRVQSGIK